MLSSLESGMIRALRWLELKIPPPVFLIVLMVAFLPGIRTPIEFYRLVTAGILFVVGVGISVATIVTMHSRTTMDPLHPERTTVLLKTGIYGWSRNPMYVGGFIVSFGWAVLLGYAIAFIIPPIFMLWTTFFQILPEERCLKQKFGAEFDEYKLAVPRWV